MWSRSSEPPPPATTNTDTDDTASVVDEDAPGPAISVPDSGDTGEGGKLKMIVQLVKKCLGVKDIAAMFVVVFRYYSLRSIVLLTH